MKIKTKMNKEALIKLNSLYTAKKTINRLKRQCSEWEKIFPNKGLISKLYKQLVHVVQ